MRFRTVSNRRVVVMTQLPMQNGLTGLAAAGSNLKTVRGDLYSARAWRRVRRAVGVLFGSALALWAVAAPQELNVDRSPVPDTAATLAIDELRLSNTLADFGERRADPIALIEAAKIRKLLPPPLNLGSDTAPGTRTWQSLLARAAQFAGADPMAKAFIADVRSLKVRDIPIIPAGIKFLRKQIKQKAADRAEVRFLAGELAVVYIHPIEGVQLDLFVYDDLNNLICTGGSTGQGLECRWRPRRDGSYLIDVRNNNSAEVDYELAINQELVPH
jgi:hypothetical protein